MIYAKLQTLMSIETSFHEVEKNKTFSVEKELIFFFFGEDARSFMHD